MGPAAPASGNIGTAVRPTLPSQAPHLNLLGRYSFTASTPAAGALRPLRDPDAPELDEDDDGGQE
ncbi:hypothetical protein IPZ61_10585 [Streptomyces sioyaensis]|uniref:hypothetical protein n=1 Tax=Streptomyces sioyaensis TaxID=67364 RepID=UPI001F37ED7F|nr:hypothetical protein [Streptomyces sioyaensis]MCF3173760.1 hypothetical protein [Streptomyces sioyaensis]